MKITSSNLDFSSQHSASSSHTLTETLRVWIGSKRPDFEGNAREQVSPPPVISPAARAAQTQDQFSQFGQSGQSAQAKAIQDAIDNANNDPVLGMIRLMVEMLIGHRVNVFPGVNMDTSAPVPEHAPAAAPVQASESASAAVRQGGGQAPKSAGFGIEYDRHEVRTETERTSFQAAGTIRTSDGKEISVQLSLTMQRSYTEESHISLRAGDAVRKDPLVINFNGTSAQLQNRRFSFDLEGDGKKENVAMLGGGSGYLALDLNGNGKIDSGKELFGAASGDGFADLAKLDSDGNGWIDESDPAFKKLRVWTPDAKGGGALSTLQDKSVGALFLGKQATPFELRDSANQSLGAVRSSGIYLTEKGTVGSLQQIDLTV